MAESEKDRVVHAICYRCSKTAKTVRFPMDTGAQMRKYGRFDWMHEIDICLECAQEIVRVLSGGENES